MSHIVARRTGKHMVDYLIGFDVIWGPSWSLCIKSAMQFPTEESAASALDSAVAIMRPVRWCTPDYGISATVYTLPMQWAALDA